MRILETQVFPHDDRFLALRWVRGSGLQGQYDHFDNLVLALHASPGYGIKSIDKPGNCLLVGDPANRELKLVDQGNRVNPRLFAAVKSDAQRDVKLFQQQQATLLGPAGGVRGRLKLGSDQDAPWALITASYLPQESTLQEQFVAQADAQGEFVIDLSGVRWPDDDSDPEFTLSVEAAEGLTPDRPADPDLFIAYRISTDASAANLQSNITVTLGNYGDVKQLGELLIAPI